MKVITIQQPWASLIIMGVKHIETRSWDTQHRGPLLIHAAASLPRFNREICYTEPFKKYITHWSHLTLGMIIGKVNLLETATAEYWLEQFADQSAFSEYHNVTEERAFGYYEPGRYGWYCAHYEAFKEPIPARGQLGLWNFPDDQLAAAYEK